MVVSSLRDSDRLAILESLFGILLKCNEPEMLDGLESSRAAPSRPMAKKPPKSTKTEPTEEVPGQSERLKRLRRAYGFETSTAFAAFLDISVQRWNAFENGAPLSREIAFLLVRKFSGLSLDWLYFGKTEALPLELVRRLGLLDPPPGKRTTA